MSKQKDNTWRNTRAKLMVKNGRYILSEVDMFNFHEISEVWFGAIFLESKIDGMASIPDFEMLDKALSCYFVEYNGDSTFWNFFWSKPPEYGHGAIFKTDKMKEDPAKNGERYFNDAIGRQQIDYNSTFTLLEQQSFEHEKTFIYRQHFDKSTFAFLGGLSSIKPEKIPSQWLNILKSTN